MSDLLKERNTALDGLRGFAMLLVFLWHCTFLGTNTVLDRLFLEVLHYSWIGMHMFFALSGFLITGILLDSKTNDGYFGNFYARRFLRIFPLYYLVLAISFFVLPHLHHAKAERFAAIAGDEWSYWLYVSNFTIAKAGQWRHAIVDVSWSLAVEEQFYIVWPLVVYMLSLKGVARVCYATLAVAFATRLYLTLEGGNEMLVYVSTVTRCDAIAAGAIAAIVLRDPGRFHALLHRYRIPALYVATAGMFALLAYTGGDYDRPLAMIAGHGIVAVFSGLLILNLVRPPSGSKLVACFNWAFFRMVGKYSYAIYLFHLPLRAVIRDLLYPPSAYLTLWGSALPGQIIFYILSGAFVLSAAWLSFHLFESKFLGLQKYFKPDPGIVAPALVR